MTYVEMQIVTGCELEFGLRIEGGVAGTGGGAL